MRKKAHIKGGRTLKLVKSDYQPKKREREDDPPLRFPEGMSEIDRFNALVDANILIVLSLKAYSSFALILGRLRL